MTDKRSPAARAKPFAPVLRLAEEIAAARQVRMSDLLGRSRLKQLVRVRQEVMYRAFKETGASLPQIGASLGRDHSTVMHGIRRHDERLLNGETP